MSDTGAQNPTDEEMADTLAYEAAEAARMGAAGSPDERRTAAQTRACLAIYHQLRELTAVLRRLSEEG